ncbi:DUF6317 family protein [Streptomyces sp. NBC_00433]
MSADVKVVLADLASMTSTFYTQATAYAALHVDVSPPVADGGDPGLNDAIVSIVDAIEGLHSKLAGRIEDHADGLSYAHDSYQRGDIDVHGLFEDLMAGD